MSWEPSGEPEPPRPPRIDRSRLGSITLIGALVVSLALNGLIGVRLTDERTARERLEAQVADQQAQLDRLRGMVGQGDDPLAAIRSAVEEIRGLRFKRPVDVETLSTAGLGQRVVDEFRKDTTRAEFDASEKVLKTLGVLSPDADLWSTFLAVQREQVAGFYDPRTKQMVVGGSDARDPSPFSRVILAHEYTHALTDQYFPLRRSQRLQKEGRDDAATAFLALVEGDATLTMTSYLRDVLSTTQQLAVVQEQAGLPRARFDALPAFLKSVIEFPYDAGLTFASTLFAQGGTEALDAAYRDPPTSTEQILHPQRYLTARDEPTTVAMPKVRRALGAGWKVIEAGEVGELDLRLIADEPVGSGGLSARDARLAADGWDGGRYVGVSSDAGTVVAMSTVWDSDAEARQARRLFARWLPLRYLNRGAPIDLGPSGDGWESPDGTGMILQRGDRLVFLLGPDTRTVQRARDAFTGF